jgi:PhnB protein
MTVPSKTLIAPMLSVRRGAKAIEYYKAAFGAEELFHIGEEGQGVVAQMSVVGRWSRVLASR